METRRDASIDIARGLAIVAIVFGHVLRGLGTSDIIDNTSSWYIAADRAVYMVHLSVFAFTAGLMVRASAEKTGVWRYARQRVGEFLWLYFLWSVLQGLVGFALSSVVNTPRSFLSIFALWRPESQLWFFPWLALMTVAVVIAQPWRSKVRAVVSLGLAAVVSLTFWGFFGEYVFTQGLGLALFYMLAATLTFQGYRRARAALGGTGPIVLFVLGGAMYVGLLVFTDAIGPTSDPRHLRDAATVLLGVLCSVAGVIGVLGLAALLEKVPVAGALFAYLGRKSLIIFLAHTLAQAGTRVVLSKVGIDDGVVQLVLGTVVSVALPLLMWKLTERWIPWLWAAPRRRRPVLAGASSPPGAS